MKGGVDATLYTTENSTPSVKLSPAHNDTEDYYLSSFGIAIGSEESEQQDRSSYIIDESTGEVTGNLPAITDNVLASELEYVESLKFIVVNNEDALLEISENKDTLECIKKLCSKYKKLNVVVIFGNVLNEQANYGAPEIYRFVKDNANMLFFDELQLCKIYDFPLSLMREKAKRLTLGDAYQVIGNEVKRIKIPLVGENKN